MNKNFISFSLVETNTREVTESLKNLKKETKGGKDGHTVETMQILSLGI